LRHCRSANCGRILPRESMSGNVQGEIRIAKQMAGDIRLDASRQSLLICHGNNLSQFSKLH
jgi:hypothetical protein